MLIGIGFMMIEIGLLLPSLAVSSVLVAVDPDDALDTVTRLRTLGAQDGGRYERFCAQIPRGPEGRL